MINYHCRFYLVHSQSNDNNKCEDIKKKSLKRTNSFVGTAQFVAPEILKRGCVHVGFVKLLKEYLHYSLSFS